MRSFLRDLGCVIGGAVAGVIVIAVVETVSSMIYPLPSGFDPGDMEALKAHAAQLPLGAFLLVLAGWGGGNLLGSWLATRVAPARHSHPGVIVGVILLAAGIANMLMLPHPAWFWVAALVMFPVCTYFGTRLGLSHS